MALRIACDLDGTLADMEGALQREAEKLFGSDVDLRIDSALPLAPLQSPGRAESGERDLPLTAPGPDAPDPSREGKRPLMDRERRQLWSHVARIENFWQGLSEIEPGAVSRLGSLVSEHGWEVIFVTQRPPSVGATAQKQTQIWLEAAGFDQPSVFVMNGSRGKLADALALDAVVDDRPDNCLDVITDSSAKALLVWRDAPETIPPAAKRLGITVTYSFAEAIDRLLVMMAERQERPMGLFGRLRRAIRV